MEMVKYVIELREDNYLSYEYVFDMAALNNNREVMVYLKSKCAYINFDNALINGATNNHREMVDYSLCMGAHRLIKFRGQHREMDKYITELYNLAITPQK